MNLNMSNIFNDGRGTSYNHASLARLEGALDLILEHLLQAKRLPEAETHETSFSVSIGHLPFEVLGIVFVLYNETQEGHHSGKKILQLIKVCRQWRDVAYGTPALWSHIIVGLGHAYEPSPSQMRVPMERARASPLDLEVVLETARPGTHAEKCLDDLLELLNILKPNFRSVTIRDYHTRSGFQYSWRPLTTIVEHLASRPQSTRSLRAFSFKRADPARVMRLPSPSQSIEKADAEMLNKSFAEIKTLSTLGIPLGILKTNHPIFEQIKHLDLATGLGLLPGGINIYIDPITDRCSSLESLTVDDGVAPDSSERQPFTLPRLTRLNLKSVINPHDLFSKIRVPALEELTIDEVVRQVGREAELRGAFKNLIEQETGTPSLKKLVIADGSVPEHTLLSTLEHFPALHYLEIRGSEKVGPKLIAALTKAPTARRGWLCPGLKCLVVSRCSRITSAELMAMVEARKDGGGKSMKKGSRKGKGKEEAVASLESVLLNWSDLLAPSQVEDWSPGMNFMLFK